MAVIDTGSGPMRARIATAARGTLAVGSEAMVFVRPETFSLAATGASGDAVVSGTVKGEEFEGPNYHLFVEGAGGKAIKVSLVNVGQSRRSAAGSPVTLAYDPEHAVALPAGKLAVD
jgi:ABC-type Fe3+/spermidine/putrescine transport system ATPase subunit